MIVRIFAILATVTFITAMSKKAPPVAEVPESHSPRIEQPSSQTEKNIQEAIIIRLPWEGKHEDANLWTLHLLRELDRIGSELVDSKPSDIKSFCSNYDSLDREQRKVFYAHMIAKMVQYESNFQTEMIFKECSKDKSTYGSSGRFFPSEGKWCIPGHKKDGGIAISRGLLQMSLQSAQAYGCEVSEPRDLHNPLKNISCGIKVLNRWIPSHGRIAGKVNGSWKGASAYWSVMRDLTGKTSYSRIKSHVSSLGICK